MQHWYAPGNRQHLRYAGPQRISWVEPWPLCLACTMYSHVLEAQLRTSNMHIFNRCTVMPSHNVASSEKQPAHGAIAILHDISSRTCALDKRGSPVQFDYMGSGQDAGLLPHRGRLQSSAAELAALNNMMSIARIRSASCACPKLSHDYSIAGLLRLHRAQAASVQHQSTFCLPETDVAITVHAIP